jgi:hypothetical protein
MNVRVENSALVWNKEENLRGWTLYKEGDDKTWAVSEFFPYWVNRSEIGLGSYALCAVDEIAQESTGVFIEVEDVVIAPDPEIVREGDTSGRACGTC